MRIEKLIMAREEADRFLRTVNKLELKYHAYMKDKTNNTIKDQYLDNPVDGSKESAACKRASMDLTRALAEMRKP